MKIFQALEQLSRRASLPAKCEQVLNIWCHCSGKPTLFVRRCQPAQQKGVCHQRRKCLPILAGQLQGDRGTPGKLSKLVNGLCWGYRWLFFA
ncbi:hypothetical protein GF064_20020 [Escherichia coli]|nr:hypothetical protein [Escherichia coli]